MPKIITWRMQHANKGGSLTLDSIRRMMRTRDEPAGEEPARDGPARDGPVVDDEPGEFKLRY